MFWRWWRRRWRWPLWRELYQWWLRWIRWKGGGCGWQSEGTVGEEWDQEWAGWARGGELGKEERQWVVSGGFQWYWWELPQYVARVEGEGRGALVGDLQLSEQETYFQEWPDGCLAWDCNCEGGRHESIDHVQQCHADMPKTTASLTWPPHLPVNFNLPAIVTIHSPYAILFTIKHGFNSSLPSLPSSGAVASKAPLSIALGLLYISSSSIAPSRNTQKLGLQKDFS